MIIINAHAKNARKKKEIENRLRGSKLPDNANLVHCQVKNHLIIKVVIIKIIEKPQNNYFYITYFLLYL